jgi:hypothetical protein
LHPSWQPFGESYFEVELPKEIRASVLVSTYDIDDLAPWFNAVRWLYGLPLKLCRDPAVVIATAP